MSDTTDEEYWKAEDRGEQPHVFIQWKGTNSCGYYRCPCGGHWHIDDSFVYNTQCPDCKQFYRVGCHITLYPVDKPDGSCKLSEPEVTFDE